MLLYLTIIFCAMTLIAGVITYVFGDNFWVVFSGTALSTLCVIAVDGLTAGAARLLPKCAANHMYRIYTTSQREKRFYEKLKIRDWKERIPEMGHLTGFRKNKIVDPKNVEYIERYLLEACYGQLGHFASLFTGFLILLLYFAPLPIATPSLWVAVSVPVAIVNFILNVPFLFVLRYNCYKLEILRKSLLKKGCVSKSS